MVVSILESDYSTNLQRLQQVRNNVRNSLQPITLFILFKEYTICDRRHPRGCAYCTALLRKVLTISGFFKRYC